MNAPEPRQAILVKRPPVHSSNINWVAICAAAFSILMSLIGIGYTAGVVSTRVTAVENSIVEVKQHSGNVDAVMQRIDTTLARIDERLSNISGRAKVRVEP